MLNDYYQNIGVKGFFKRYGIINALKRGLFLANPFHYIKDYEVKKLLWQTRAKKKASKYMKYKDVVPEGLEYSNKECENVIWVYWNSGIDNAPEIIKKCYESIIKYSNKEVILLTENNVDEYVKLPEYVIVKKNNGAMPLAIYTDLLRFALLDHYGGTWIDASVLLTDNLQNEILESDFFALQNSLCLIENPVLYPVWFIHAKKNNILIKQIRNISFAYWKYETHVFEYLFSNLIMTEVINMNPKEKAKIKYMNSDYSEYLIKVLGDEYSEEKMSWIEKLTNIHKLTYKLDESINKENSIYRKLFFEAKE